MNTQEFKSKYHDSTVRIPIGMSLQSSEQISRSYIESIRERCARVGLRMEFFKTAAMLFPHYSVYICDDETTTRIGEKPTYDENEFNQDWKDLMEFFEEEKKRENEKKFAQVYEELRNMGIQSDTVEETDMLPNVAQETGYIQGFTSNHCVLW